MSILQPAGRIGSKYLNPIPTQLGGASLMLKVLPRFLIGRKLRSPQRLLGPFRTDVCAYEQPPASGLRVTWFGHSSMLLEIDSFRILIDPVWEERASPYRWIGPKRFFEPTLALTELPTLDAILISHDHYDHLGANTVHRLAKNPHLRKTAWITSKGVGTLLCGWGVQRSQVVELDWTESHKLKGETAELHLTAWPARHFSGRKLSNRFETLWSSFAIEGNRHRVFYGADSGPWPGFAEIGNRYGHFDLTMLEIGAYDPLWEQIHLGPDGAVEAFQELNAGGLFMPVHWGLFDLALHAWTQPIERTEFLAAQFGIPLWSPEPGVPTEVVADTPLRSNWWM